MPKKQRKFADDGWAIWIDGDDTSTVYINDWLNPKGTSYVDVAVRIRGIKASKALHVYIPFVVSSEEIDDISLRFDDTKILQATFSSACIVDYKKNEHTSEIAYNGKTVDMATWAKENGIGAYVMANEACAVACFGPLADSDNPKTGDNAPIAVAAALAVLALGGMAITISKKKEF